MGAMSAVAGARLTTVAVTQTTVRAKMAVIFMLKNGGGRVFRGRRIDV
jgi:hypothetical protein